MNIRKGNLTLRVLGFLFVSGKDLMENTKLKWYATLLALYKMNERLYDMRKNKKPCSICKLGSQDCVYMNLANTAKTDRQRFARESLCKTCPCFSKYNKCLRSFHSGCENCQPVEKE